MAGEKRYVVNSVHFPKADSLCHRVYGFFRGRVDGEGQRKYTHIGAPDIGEHLFRIGVETAAFHVYPVKTERFCGSQNGID